jgi:hypothetical protein
MVCDTVPDYDMKTVIGDLTLKLEKSPIYTKHVESTVFTTKQMIMEKEW